MKCLFLAAGYATRLYPLTKNYPKPLLEISGKPILDWLIEDLETTKRIDEYIVVSNHRFISHFKEWKSHHSQKITIVDDRTETNETRLGAIADIGFVIKKLSLSDDLLVLAGDNVLDFSLKCLIDFYDKKQSSSVFYYEERDISTLPKRSCMSLDENQKIIRMAEKPEKPFSNLCCPPFYLYKKEDLKYIDKMIKQEKNLDSPGAFVDFLSRKTSVFAMKMPGKRYDIGTIETYNKANKTYKGIIEGVK